MYVLEQTPEFETWFNNLRDNTIKNRLLARLARVENGNFGDYKVLDSHLMEFRMTFGGGLRVYYTKKKKKIILLLQGGDKSSQSRDIDKAKQLLVNLED